MRDESVSAKVKASSSSFILPPSSFVFGGGVWESNPPAPALTGALTVLKTAPLTRTDAPPFVWRDAANLSGARRGCQARGRRLTRARAAVHHWSRLIRPHYTLLNTESESLW